MFAASSPNRFSAEVALLIDDETGRIVQVIRGLFW